LEHSLLCKKNAFNFLHVVRQHILGAVSNVTHCFVGNLTDFPAVKNFENRLRCDEIIVTRGWHVFWDTVYKWFSSSRFMFP